MAEKINIYALCIGPQKCGTTWLYEILRRQSELAFPAGVKETFFFDVNYSKGLTWYYKHFTHSNAALKNCEVAPTYFDCIEAIGRIKSISPECKIIITLRDPAQRAYSLYLHHRKKGRISTCFEDAAVNMPRLIAAGFYRDYIPKWIAAFGADNIHIVLQDDIATEPGMVIRSIFDFLGLEGKTCLPDLEKRINVATLPRYQFLAKTFTLLAAVLRRYGLYTIINFGKRCGLKGVYSGYSCPIPELAPETRKLLIDIYRPHIRYIEILLNRDLSQWKAF